MGPRGRPTPPLPNSAREPAHLQAHWRGQRQGRRHTDDGAGDGGAVLELDCHRLVGELHQEADELHPGRPLASVSTKIRSLRAVMVFTQNFYFSIFSFLVAGGRGVEGGEKKEKQTNDLSNRWVDEACVRRDVRRG
jgi:hypothetical protein